MIRSLPRLLLMGFALAGLSAAPGRAETLTVATNGGSISAAMQAAFFRPFAASTGHRIVEDIFSQELARLRSQVETGNLIWDVVSVTAINEATGCDEGLLEPIDWASLLDPKDFEAVGGLGRCGVPNNFVSGGLVYDGAAFPAGNGPRNWADFWDVQRFPGKRGLLYRAEQTLEVALMADGVPPADVMRVLAAPGGVDRAFRKLAELRPHILWWRTGDESMQRLLTGEVTMTYGWNGRVAVANRSANRQLRIEFGGGHVSGSQYFAVMKGTPRMALARDLIRFTSSPEAQANYARGVDYAPANARALPLMTAAELATLPGGHMHLASLQGGQAYFDFWINNGDALLQRFITFAAQ
jgi:putative spermidine/putrescine transport system substrate-binding protein